MTACEYAKKIFEEKSNIDFEFCKKNNINVLDVLDEYSTIALTENINREASSLGGL